MIKCILFTKEIVLDGLHGVHQNGVRDSESLFFLFVPPSHFLLVNHITN